MVSWSDVRESKGARLEQESAVEAGPSPGRGKSSDGAEARAHQTAACGLASSGRAASSLGTRSSVRKRACRSSFGVLGEAIGRVREGDDEVGDLEPVDQVVENRDEVGVTRVVVTVVYDEERVAAGRTEPGGEIEAYGPATQGWAVEDDFVEPSWLRLRDGVQSTPAPRNPSRGRRSSRRTGPALGSG